jgi:hypothetical protein
MGVFAILVGDGGADAEQGHTEHCALLSLDVVMSSIIAYRRRFCDIRRV